MLVAIYARVSTKDKQEVENQLAQLREYCAKANLVIYREYIDHESGGKADRTEFKALFADAHQKKFDLVLVWALDRFSREGVRPTINYLCQLESYGIRFTSYTEQYLDTAGLFREAIISILATLAKQEKIRISERVKAGLAIARAKGVKLGRRSVAPKDNKKIIDTYEKIKTREGKAPSINELAALVNKPRSTVAKIVRLYRDGDIDRGGAYYDISLFSQES